MSKDSLLAAGSQCTNWRAPPAASACTVARACQVYLHHVQRPATCRWLCLGLATAATCLRQSPATVDICSLLLSEGVVYLQTLAEVHGHLCTHDDIKLENIHVAVKQPPADTAVTVLDFGISGYHSNGGSPS